MKRFFALIVLFYLTQSSTPSWALTIVTEEFPPLNFTKNGEAVGLSVEIVTEVMHRLGEIDPIQILPWARAYNMTQTLPNVLIFSAARTPEREDRLIWVGALATINWVLYAKEGSGLTINSLDDARNLSSIGVYRNSGPHQMLIANDFSNLDLSDDNVQLLRKLLVGRLDAVLINQVAMAQLLKELGKTMADVEPLLTARTLSLYAAFSLGTDPAIVESWRKIFHDLDQEGFIKARQELWLQETEHPR